MCKPTQPPFSKPHLIIQILTLLLLLGLLIILSLLLITLKEITLKTSDGQLALQIYWGGGDVNTFVRGLPA